MAVDKLSDEDLERLRKAADVASRRFSFVCFSVHGREDCTRTYLLYSSMIMLLQLLAIR